MTAKARTWIALTVVAVLAIVAGGYFLLVAPKMAATADTRTSIEQEKSRTVALAAQLAKLKDQNAHLDDYRAQRDGLRAQVPATAAMSSYRQALASLAQASGVTIETITAGTGALPPAPAAAAAPTDTASATADAGADGKAATDGASPAATQVPAASKSQIVGIPVSITVIGTYAATSGFLSALQTGTDRLVVVSGLNAVSQAESPASGGRPATSAGDLELSLTGYVLVVPAEATPAAPTAAAPAAPVLPSSERNVFAPVG